MYISPKHNKHYECLQNDVNVLKAVSSLQTPQTSLGFYFFWVEIAETICPLNMWSAVLQEILH